MTMNIILNIGQFKFKIKKSNLKYLTIQACKLNYATPNIR
jgi:hypothetical protein